MSKPASYTRHAIALSLAMLLAACSPSHEDSSTQSPDQPGQASGDLPAPS